MTAPDLLSCGLKPSSNTTPGLALRLTCIGLWALALASNAQAQDSAPLSTFAEAPARQWAQLDGPRLPARNTGALDGTAASAATPEPAFKPPWFTGSDAHKYLGLGTLVLVGMTAATAPHENECEHNCAASTSQRQTSGTTHTRLARAAATMAGATVATGLLVHWDDFHLRDGFSDPDNQHVLLGLAGSLLMLYAVNKSMHSTVPTQHAAFAEVGGAAMAIAVKLTW